MENNKEKLKKLESQYNKYIKIIKYILLIALFIFLILAIRFMFIFSILNKSIQIEEAPSSTINMKKTYSFIYPDFPENNTGYIYYCKDGVIVMKAGFVETYSIDNTYYSFYPTSDPKTYSIHELSSSETWEDLSFFKKIIVIAVRTSSYFTANISHEKLNGKKCIVFTINDEKAYYDEQTSLHVRTVSKNSIVDIKYEFDVVTDEDIKLPNLNEYILQDD